MTEEEGVEAFRLHWPSMKDAEYEDVRRQMRAGMPPLESTMTEEETVEAFRLHWPSMKGAKYEDVRRFMLTRMGGNTPVSVVVPWVYEGRPGTLCIVGKAVKDQNDPRYPENVWKSYSGYFHEGKSIFQVHGMKNDEARDLSYMVWVFCELWETKGLGFVNFVNEYCQSTRKQKYWEWPWKLFVFLGINAWKVVTTIPVIHEAEMVNEYPRYITTYWGVPPGTVDAATACMDPQKWYDPASWPQTTNSTTTSV
jgi:hypothetical protein